MLEYESFPATPVDKILGFLPIYHLDTFTHTSHLNLKQLRNTFSIPEFLSPPKMKIVVTCEKKFIFKDFSQVFSVKGKVVT